MAKTLTQVQKDNLAKSGIDWQKWITIGEDILAAVADIIGLIPGGLTPATLTATLDGTCPCPDPNDGQCCCHTAQKQILLAALACECHCCNGSQCDTKCCCKEVACHLLKALCCVMGHCKK